MLDWVHRFYDEYYFRAKPIYRIVKGAIFKPTGAQTALQGGQGISGDAGEEARVGEGRAGLIQW